MTLKHLLVHMDAGERTAVRLDMAIDLARRFDARLTGLFAQKENFGPSLVARRASDRLTGAMREARALFEERTAAAGLKTEWWQVEHGEYSHVIGQTAICCRYADLAVFGQYDAEKANMVPEDLVEQVLLHSGRPVLVVPYVGSYPPPGRRVLVAWNGSREAARAINDAIPLMREAEYVGVLHLQFAKVGIESGPVPQVDITAHLACHGIQATHERMTIEDISVADMVLNRCFDEKADLLVMGGYGQYAFPFLPRGGNTRQIMRNLTLPVLLSH